MFRLRVIKECRPARRQSATASTSFEIEKNSDISTKNPVKRQYFSPKVWTSFSSDLSQSFCYSSDLVYLSNVVATTFRLNRKVSYGFSYFGKRRSFKASKLSTIHSFLIPDQHFNEFQQTPHSATPEVLLAFITTRKDGDHSASCARYHFHCPHEFGV
jgi:hypothetical protein